MKKSLKSLFLLAFIGIAFVSCTSVPGGTNSQNPLSLWTDEAPAKKALIEYVSSVTKKSSLDFIPVENRIAIFDWDGTLFCETNPTYFDFQLFIHRVLDDPNYTPNESQLAIAKKFRETGVVPPLDAEYERLLASAYKGMKLSEYFDYVRAFMQTEQPGYNGMKRAEAYYRPMAQIVQYLIDNQFTVYVSTGTDRFTIRPLVMETLKLPPNQIIGSDSVVICRNQGGEDSLSYTFNSGDELVMGGKNIVKNLQMNKVVTIVREIGVQPVLAFGNSTTDASMINYSITNNKYKALGFMLCCDDLEREYGNMKKAEKMKSESEKYGWISVSMKNDWKTIYGESVKKK